MTVNALDAKSAMDIPLARIFVGRTSAAYAYGDVKEEDEDYHHAYS